MINKTDTENNKTKIKYQGQERHGKKTNKMGAPPPNYTATALVTKLHGLSHYSPSLQISSNSFQLHESYYESLAMFATPFGIFLILALITMIVSCCYAQCRRNRKQRNMTPPKPRFKKGCWKNFSPVMFIIGLLGLAALPVGLVGSLQVSKAVKNFDSSIDNAQSIFNSIMVKSSIIESWAPATKHDVYRLEESVPQLILNEYKDQCVQMNKSLDQLHGTMKEITDQKDAFNTDEFVSDIEKVNHYRSTVTMAFEALLFIAVATIVVNSLASRGTCVAWSSSILWGILFVCTVIISASYFITMVGVADFCSNPNSYIVNITIEQSDNGNSAHIAQCGGGDINEMKDVECIVGYYINCPPGNSPFISAVVHAKNQFAQAEGELEKAKKVLSQYNLKTEDVERLEKDLDKGDVYLDHLADEVKCGPVHAEYVDAVTALCNDALDGLALMMLSTFIVSVILAAASVAVHCTRNQNNDYRLVNGEQADDVDLLILNTNPNDLGIYGVEPDGSPAAANFSVSQYD